MQTLIVKTESEAATKLLLAFLKTVRLVKSVTVFSPETNPSVVNESSEAYNWIDPSRPAADEEIEQMLDECDRQYTNGEFLTLGDAKSLTKKKIAEWKKAKTKTK